MRGVNKHTMAEDRAVQKERQILLENKMRQVVAENPYMQFLGVELMEIREDYGLARMKYNEKLANPYGMFHGGSLYSLADIVAGTVGCMCGYYVTTVSGNMNFLLPTQNTEYVYCEVARLRLGKHLAVFDIRIKNDDGQVLDSGEFTFFVTEQKVLE